MNGLAFKKITFAFFALCLIFSGLDFSALPARARDMSAKAASPVAAAVFLPTIKVVSAAAQPVLLAGVRQNCAVAAVSDLLQGSSAAGLFSRPANCFSLNVAKIQISPVPLAVQDAPANLPHIVVNDFSNQLQNAFSFPAFPFRQSAGPLPMAAGIVLLLFVFFEKLQSGRGNSTRNVRLSQFPAFEKLQILRC